MRLIIAAMTGTIIVFTWGFVSWAVLEFWSEDIEFLPTENASAYQSFMGSAGTIPDSGVYVFPARPELADRSEFEDDATYESFQEVATSTWTTETRKGPFLPPEVLNALHEALNQIGYAEPSKKGPFAMKRLADLIEYAPAAAAPPTPTQGAASVPASAAGGPSRNEFRLTGQGRSSAAVAFKQGLVRSSEIERDFKLVRTEGVMLGPSPLHLVYLCTAKSDALEDGPGERGAERRERRGGEGGDDVEDEEHRD